MAEDKKSMCLQILCILKKHSDVNHKLDLYQIKEYLEKKYNQVVKDTRTINANIDMLNEYLDDAIEFETNKVKDKKRGTVEKRHSFYIIRDFDESELRLLIDSVLSSASIPDSQCDQLLDKLRNEASSYFKYKKNLIKRYTSGLKGNEELFTSIEVIGEAIEENKKITFNYAQYNIKKELVNKLDDDGKDKLYKLTPLRMVVNNGRYYLFGVPDIYDDLSIYRLDKIKNAKKLDEDGKSKNQIKELKTGMDLGKHIAEHIFMTLGPSQTIIFEFDKKHISFVIDWFGKDILLQTKGDICIGHVTVNVQSFINWLMMCSFIGAKVTGPESVVEKVKARAKEINDLYNIE